MKLSICTAALVAALIAPVSIAFADETGGIAGNVVDAHGQKLANVRLEIYQLPVVERDTSRMHETRTSDRGYFVQMGLSAGTYVVLANAEGRKIRCVIRNVYEGRVRHVTLTASANAAEDKCEANYPPNFDPDETADVYRIY
ncbi:MAG: carboxypeptidase regulatory-like domain-containing protein [Candidatus Eremiobacteraeota bacterium]|nr:carboxypeptidase regulatory-like domain-containing protein [Candidatus Eremiobacteraeota bacterium]